MVASGEQTMAALNSFSIVLDETAESYNLLYKGKPVSFSYIPSEIDGRGGLNNRTTTQLLGEGDNRGNAFSPSSDQLKVQYRVPFIVFPKGFFADDRCSALGVTPNDKYANSYTMLQGNTRFLVLNQLMQQNIEALRAAKSVGTSEALESFRNSQVLFDDVNFQILSLEEAQNPELVQWMQVAVNNGVSGHTLAQQMDSVVGFVQFLKKTHPDWSADQIKIAAGKAYGKSHQRIGQFLSAKKDFPEWLLERIDQGCLTFDTAVKLVSRYNNRIAKLGEMSLVQFYNELWSRAVEGTDAASSDTRITQPLVDKVTNELAPKQKETEDNANLDQDDLGEGSGEGGSGDGEGSGSSPKEDPYKDLTVTQKEDQVSAKLLEVLDHVSQMTLIEGWTEKSLNGLLKACDSFMVNTTITTDTDSGKLTTVAMEQAIAEAKEAQKLAAKAKGFVEDKESKKNSAPSETEAVATV